MRQMATCSPHLQCLMCTDTWAEALACCYLTLPQFFELAAVTYVTQEMMSPVQRTCRLHVKRQGHEPL